MSTAWTSRYALRTKGITSSQIRELLKFRDRKSTRLNSSHHRISYAVFCLKKQRCPEADVSAPIDPADRYPETRPERDDTKVQATHAHPDTHGRGRDRPSLRDFFFCRRHADEVDPLSLRPALRS